MWYVTQKGENRMVLFLIDRNKDKSRWWTTNLYMAMAFRKKSAAEYSANRLKYGEIEVVGQDEAEYIDHQNTIHFAEADHPFSSDALGQY